ncbi:MAG TPA: peptidoglycan DD-metalloendopeptidase family protein [Gaiellaceae bacterium]|nr:peptidoglycan DD-metalloendopeptidase family protein [Gaiellaceae bacterium]HET8652585.1 peptidoglycan DD-metalloendopeptidase family protein [Gaiellaceae bacterium]
MARRIVCSLVLVLLAAAPASASLYDRKQQLDQQAQALQSKADAARAREASLRAEIASVSERIQALEGEVGDVSSRLAALEEDLALHQRKLEAVKALYRLQSERLEYLRGQYQVAQSRLADRLVAVYEGEDPTTLDVVLEASSFGDILDQLDYLDAIADQDRKVVTHVAGARDHMRELRQRTGRTKARVAAITRVVEIRTQQQRAVYDRLLISRKGLAEARSAKRQGVQAAHEAAEQYEGKAEELLKVSAQLAARINAAQQSSASYSSTGDGTVSSAGLVWPVGGPVVSGFGWRWGRMHEGIDIAAGYGTPIQAAAAGNVIYAGWMGGYGNLIIIDHGNGLATAYAHQSSFVVGGGAVSQGQTIGYIGCTGHCFGPHLHFEVRVNGSPVDPLGYL